MADTSGTFQDGKASNPKDKCNNGIVDLLDSCLLTARRLLSLLDEETLALKAFNSDHLVEVYPRKEALAKELMSGVKVLIGFSETRPEKASSPIDSSAVQAGLSNVNGNSQASTVENQNQQKLEKALIEKKSSLKQLLTEIEKQNYRNHIFIQGSLSYFQDLLSVFIPGTYGPAQQGILQKQQPTTKGLTLNREV